MVPRHVIESHCLTRAILGVRGLFYCFLLLARVVVLICAGLEGICCSFHEISYIFARRLIVCGWR